MILQKAGDVIPEVVRPIPEKRTGAEREYEMPPTCPVCATPIVRDEGAVRYYCPNVACPARVGQEYGHFAGRGGMDIEGAGWAVLEQLLQRGLVKRRGDFYRLSVEDLETLDRFARKSAENLHRAIQRSRRRPLERIIAALGIPQVGWTTAIDLAVWLAEQVPARDGEPMAGRDGWLARAAAFLATTAREQPERFEEVAGVGPTVAASIARYFAEEGGAEVLDDLVDAGVEPELAGAPARRRPTPVRFRARPSSSPARSRGSHARRPRRRSGRRAASPAGPSRARPTTSSPARRPARSWPRPRSSECRSSTRTASDGCWPAKTLRPAAAGQDG